MNRRQRWIRSGLTCVALSLLLLIAGVSRGQDPGAGQAPPEGDLPRQEDNPHGDLDEKCSLCHSPDRWVPAEISPVFDHGKFGFPLLSAHGTAQCMACHRSLIFDEVGTACLSCHEDTHNNELGTNCANCHTERSFIERTQMMRWHQLTRFPLRGTHAATDCNDCHIPAAQGQMVWVGKDTRCESCHFDEFTATTAPAHALYGFPQDCRLCHTETAWELGRMTTDEINHDGFFFPVFSGSHRNTWVRCNECHVSQTDFATFSCILCHEHSDPVRVAGQHQGISGYQFTTQACYSCHPQGEI